MRAKMLTMTLPLLAVACTDMTGTTGTSGTGAPPTVDLTVEGLEDVNPTSQTLGETVHPNDFTGSATAWYFGHAT